MTRKDYDLIAKVIAVNAVAPADWHIHTHEGSQWELGAETERREIAERMAIALSTTNPWFDRDQFLAACGALYRGSVKA